MPFFHFAGTLFSSFLFMFHGTGIVWGHDNGSRCVSVLLKEVFKFNFQIYECSGIKYVDTGKSDVISRGVAVGYDGASVAAKFIF